MIVLTALFLLAADITPPALPPGVTCEDVRYNVQVWGKWLALKYARANYTRQQVEEALKCLKQG